MLRVIEPFYFNYSSCPNEISSSNGMRPNNNGKRKLRKRMEGKGDLLDSKTPTRAFHLPFLLVV